MASVGDLPEGVLLDVLSLVPSKDLICNCRLVCSQWRDLVDLPILWKRKFEQEDSASDWKESKIFYILCHMEKNLIQNPCGEEGLDSWEIEVPPEGQWKTEEVSEKDSLELETTDILLRNIYMKDEDIPYQHVKKCFVACNGLCVKSQRITLKDHGYWDQLIDEINPTIVVKDWYYYTRHCLYRLCVKLLSADFKVLQEYCSGDEYKSDLKDNEWREVSYTFNSCPAGVRHVLFQHQGNWERPGSGMRMTKSSLTLGPFSCYQFLRLDTRRSNICGLRFQTSSSNTEPKTIAECQLEAD
ncbi:F-box only protein 44-like [Elgaria multicarinata webbii]|uniref:F-box only protein 44-like n=1 Tax=Elgaria multicarinata webbii TaxID=159646 RepID=UPI002FCD27B3